MERDMIVFFYKKKTAYEVRISDWSSDVCSSDLRAQLVTHVGEELGLGAVGGLRLVASGRQLQAAACLFLLQAMVLDRLFLEHLDRARHVAHLVGAREIRHRGSRIASGNAAHGADERSEEHTSELQSLMRISYAVFCLKKKNRIITSSHTQTLH